MQGLCGIFPSARARREQAGTFAAPFPAADCPGHIGPPGLPCTLSNSTCAMYSRALRCCAHLFRALPAVGTGTA